MGHPERTFPCCQRGGKREGPWRGNVDAAKTYRPQAVLGRMVMGKVGGLEVMGQSSGHELMVRTWWAQR